MQTFILFSLCITYYINNLCTFSGTSYPFKEMYERLQCILQYNNTIYVYPEKDLHQYMYCNMVSAIQA